MKAVKLKEEKESEDSSEKKTGSNKKTGGTPLAKKTTKASARGKGKFIGSYVPEEFYAALSQDARSQGRTVSKHIEWLLSLGLVIRGKDISLFSTADLSDPEFQIAIKAMEKVKDDNEKLKTAITEIEEDEIAANE